MEGLSGGGFFQQFRTLHGPRQGGRMAGSHLETLCPPSSLESMRFDPSGEADEKPALP